VVVLIARVVAVAALVAGCYRPELQDCTVRCSGPGDCADGQVCARGWCAAADHGERCDDASSVDADPDGSVDGPGAELHLVVSGRGSVLVEPLGVSCEGTQSTPGDCRFPAAPGVEVTLLPVPTHPQTSFAGWTTDNCAAAADACTIEIEAPVVLVGARFGT
jgi:hypothetical protein